MRCEQKEALQGNTLNLFTNQLNFECGLLWRWSSISYAWKKVSVNEGAQDVNQVKIMSSDFSDKHFKKVALP